MNVKHLNLKETFLSLLLMISANASFAFEKAGLQYSVISSSDLTCQVVSGTNYSGDIIIPDKVTNDQDGLEYTVTKIGRNAFNGTAVTSVSIPNTVTEIDEYSFANCTGLTSITIPNSVISIGRKAIADCSSLEEIDIPNSVKTIGVWAFEGCSNLATVHVGSGIETIGERAFSGCSSVTAVHITDLAKWCNISFAFMDSNPLGSAASGRLYLNGKRVREITIPDGITVIKKWTFYGCDGLTSVTIPEGVTTIENEAFRDCSDLETVSLPEGLNVINNWAFYHCTGLTSINIPSSVTTIGESVFSGCSSLPSIELPDGITTLADELFYGCTSLSSVKIPNSVTSIGNQTFRDCTGLLSIEIPNSVKSLGTSAFQGCKSMTSVKMGSGVTSIGNNAFNIEYTVGTAPKLTSVHISDLKAWCNIAFGMNSNPLGIARKLYLNGELVQDLVIPSGVTEIKNYAFYKASCLTSVKINDEVTAIGYDSFYGCSGLKSVIVGNNVKTIDAYAFAECPKINTITLGKKLNTINARAFYSSGSVSVIRSLNPIPPVAYDQTFKSGIESTCVLYVPEDSKIDYELEDVWEGFANIVEFDTDNFGDFGYKITSEEASTVSVSPNIAVGNIEISGTTEIDNVSYTVTRIESGAFSGFSDITSVVIPQTVTSIGANAFDDCTGISQITCYAVTPPTVDDGGIFNGVSKEDIALYVPSEAIGDYMAHEVWGQFNVQSAKMTVSVTSLGLATYSPAYPVDFSSAEKIWAYKAAVNGSSVKLTKVFTVAAGEGVLLRALSGGAETEELPIATSTTTAATDNEFVGTLADKQIYQIDGDKTNYVLSAETTGVGFYKARLEADGGTTVPAGKAYLPVTTSLLNGVNSFSIRWDDETTGIVSMKAGNDADAVYSLQGVRIDNPGKGLYIRNGKKVLVK